MTIRTTDISTLELLPNKVVRHTYKDGSVVDLDEAQRVVGIIEEMIGQGNTKVILNDLRAKVAFSREARDFFKNNGDHTTVMAFLINSKIGEVTVNFYLKFNQPDYQMRIFTDEQEAMQWLERHC